MPSPGCKCLYDERVIHPNGPPAHNSALAACPLTVKHWAMTLDTAPRYLRTNLRSAEEILALHESAIGPMTKGLGALCPLPPQPSRWVTHFRSDAFSQMHGGSLIA